MNIRLSTDTVAGAFFCGVAIIGIVLSSRLQFGTPARMGPGFFPMSLSVMLLLLGGTVLLRGSLSKNVEAIGTVRLRPLLTVLAGVVLFGLLLEPLGFAIATALLIVIARAAEGPFRPLEVAVLATCLIVASSLLFITALKLPLRVFPL